MESFSPALPRPAFLPSSPFTASHFLSPSLAQRPLRSLRRSSPSRVLPRMQSALPRREFGTSAPDEIASFITENLGLGDVVSMRRAGSSGWAVMHKAATADGTRLFIKVSRGDESMFAGEAEGLSAMSATRTLRVPRVRHYGSLESGKGAFIVMEDVPFEGVFDQADLGRGLAEMHLAPPAAPEAAAGKFGFTVDNTIGGTAQPNGWMDDWVEFFRERRLRHQVLLTGDDELYRVGGLVCDKMHELFVGCGEVRPSVLHGDLWSGNVNGVDGSPIVYDPATYYGHHEAEFGMAWCAGFSPAFWEAYHEVIPKAPGFKERHDLYTAYHALNHFNLFGGGYKAMALACLNRLL